MPQIFLRWRKTTDFPLTQGTKIHCKTLMLDLMMCQLQINNQWPIPFFHNHTIWHGLLRWLNCCVFSPNRSHFHPMSIFHFESFGHWKLFLSLRQTPVLCMSLKRKFQNFYLTISKIIYLLVITKARFLIAHLVNPSNTNTINIFAFSHPCLDSTTTGLAARTPIFPGAPFC